MSTDPVIVSVKSIQVLFVVLKFQGPPIVKILPNNIYGVGPTDIGTLTGLLDVAIDVPDNSCVTLVISIIPPALDPANITL
jgi:hypothetical protein